MRRQEPRPSGKRTKATPESSVPFHGARAGQVEQGPFWAADDQTAGDEENESRENEGAPSGQHVEEQDLSAPAKSIVFDPHPSVERQKSLRKSYAALIKETSGSRSELTESDNGRLNGILADANRLMATVQTPTDATLDSHLIAMTAELGVERINRIAAEAVDFTLGDLVTILKGALFRRSDEETAPRGAPSEGEEGSRETLDRLHLGDDEAARDDDEDALGEDEGHVQANWARVEDLACRHWRGVSIPQFLYGAIQAEVAEKLARPSRDRTHGASASSGGGASSSTAAEVVRPILLDGAQLAASERGRDGLASASETSNNVVRVFQILQDILARPKEGRGSGDSLQLSLYRFIVDPQSFSRSVENLFYVSFLVSDNRLCLSLPEGADQGEAECDPTIEIISPDDEASSENDWDQKPKFQRVYALTMALWRRMIEKHAISTAMISLA